MRPLLALTQGDSLPPWSCQLSIALDESVSSMGLLVGNFLGLVLILIGVGLGYDSLQLTSRLYLGTSYGLWLLFLVANLTSRPKQDSDFCKTLTADAVSVYRRYHVAIDHPMAGQVYAGILNFLRVAGLVFTGLAIWKGFYIEAGACFLFFLVSASLIHRNNPWLFLGHQAGRSNERALRELDELKKLLASRHPSHPPEA